MTDTTWKDKDKNVRNTELAIQVHLENRQEYGMPTEESNVELRNALKQSKEHGNEHSQNNEQSHPLLNMNGGGIADIDPRHLASISLSHEQMKVLAEGNSELAEQLRMKLGMSNKPKHNPEFNPGFNPTPF